MTTRFVASFSKPRFLTWSTSSPIAGLGIIISLTTYPLWHLLRNSVKLYSWQGLQLPASGISRSAALRRSDARSQIPNLGTFEPQFRSTFSQ